MFLTKWHVVQLAYDSDATKRGTRGDYLERSITFWFDEQGGSGLGLLSQLVGLEMALEFKEWGNLGPVQNGRSRKANDTVSPGCFWFSRTPKPRVGSAPELLLLVCCLADAEGRNVPPPRSISPVGGTCHHVGVEWSVPCMSLPAVSTRTGRS
jgi:hypothetical protein